MISNKTTIRVRYCDVDRMGYLHHGNYAAYFEVGRTELLRKKGLTYKAMEDDGIILPVRNLNVEYKAPAYYDDELTLQTTLKKLEGVRLYFDYTLFNQNEELLCQGETMLVFADAKTGKPRKAPDDFLIKLN